MRVAVIGVGGAGGYFGARLAEAGHDVSLVVRGEHLAAIRAGGLHVESVKGDVVIRPTHATDDPAEIGVVDCVLVGVKAWQVPDAVRGAKALVGPSTVVVPLQNGVTAADEIGEAVGAQHALGGIAKIISYRIGPGRIKHDGVDPVLEIGELDGTRSARVEALHAAFQQAKGVTTVISPDIRVALWAKFLFITPYGGVGAVTRAPIGAIRGIPETRQLLQGAMEEIESVARAKGVALPREIVAKTMGYVDGLPPHGSSSLQRDIIDGKPSELESLCGAVGRLGAAAGVATPINTAIYRALLPLERRARGQLEF